MAALRGRIGQVGPLFVLALLAPPTLAFRSNLDALDTVHVPPATRSLSRRLVGALATSAGRLGGGAAAAAPAAPAAKVALSGVAARYSSSVEGVARGAAAVHDFKEDLSKHLGAQQLSSHISADAWDSLGSPSAKVVVQPLDADSVAGDFVDQFLDTLERNDAVESAWELWGEFKAHLLPRAVQRDESINAVEGALVLAVVNYPDMAESAAHVVKDMVTKAARDVRAKDIVTLDVADWLDRSKAVRDKLLLRTSLDKEEVVRFGRWVRARILLEDIGAHQAASTPVALVRLKEALAFAAEHHANQEEVLQEIEGLHAEAMQAKRCGMTLATEEWSERITQTMQSLLHLGERSAQTSEGSLKSLGGSEPMTRHAVAA